MRARGTLERPVGIFLTPPSPPPSLSPGPSCSLQSDTISTFNMLLAEGRSVAAALISSEPVSREDACLYGNVQELAALNATDLRVAEALEKDVQVLQKEEALLQLEAGSSSSSSSAKQLPGSGSSSGSQLAPAVQPGGALTSAAAASALNRGSAAAASARAPVPAGLSALLQPPPARSRRFGVSGELEQQEADSSAAAGAAGQGASALPGSSGAGKRVGRPSSYEDLMDSMSRKGSRRSGTGSSS